MTTQILQNPPYIPTQSINQNLDLERPLIMYPQSGYAPCKSEHNGRKGKPT